RKPTREHKLVWRKRAYRFLKCKMINLHMLRSPPCVCSQAVNVVFHLCGCNVKSDSANAVTCWLCFAVDGCIHRAAGPCLVAECRNLSGCETGQAKITCGYELPAKYVIHTVGPIARGHLTDTHKEDLASCYKSSMKLAKENSIKSIAFPCISTGIYGFPNEPAAVIALNTIKEWLRKNHNEVDRVIFCVFLEVDYKIFKKKMSKFFPLGRYSNQVPAVFNKWCSRNHSVAEQLSPTQHFWCHLSSPESSPKLSPSHCAQRGALHQLGLWLKTHPHGGPEKPRSVSRPTQNYLLSPGLCWEVLVWGKCTREGEMVSAEQSSLLTSIAHILDERSNDFSFLLNNCILSPAGVK
uniref:Macro domain-containing protein n=1 Tax=Nothoprocta perdicaria TaxID=30464 RepID=A0A8C6Z2T2_NOTPE